MRVKLEGDDLALIRWCCKLIEDTLDAGIIENSDYDCRIELDGRLTAWLTVALKTEDDREILDEIMENVNIRLTYVDLTKPRPKYTYSLNLGGEYVYQA